MKILVTGANGFIGKSLIKFLDKKISEDEVIGVVKELNPSKFINNSRISFIEANLLNKNLENILPKDIDVIIHLAGKPNTFLTSEESRQQFLENVKMTSNVLDFAEKTTAKRIIFSSSCYVYTNENKLPFNEKLTAVPSNSLGASKLASEALLKAHSISKGVDVVCLRLFTVYGPNSREIQFIPEAIKKILSNEGPATFGNGSVERDFVFIDDVLEAFSSAIHKDISKQFITLNIGSGIACSIEKIVDILKESINPNKKIVFAKEKAKDSQVDPNHLADVSSAKKYLDWKPKTDIHLGLNITIQSIRESN
jgi:nucleoside-diphosphate-sugar epimerase|tara:strand:- start:324 stop:1253 length:930 start_codon:yes stop_codon:yes gene_type:complete